MNKLTDQFDVITVGDVFIDLVMTGFKTWPQPGQEAFATGIHREIGGGAAITACGLARLGANVSTLSCIGADDDQWFIRRLTDCGVDPALIQKRAAETTGTTVCVSGAADRAFFTYSGANRFLTELLADSRQQKHLRQARHVHIAMPIASSLFLELTEALHSDGITVSIDVGWQQQWLTGESNWSAIQKADLFLPNEREAELMTGESEPEAMLRKFAESGFRRVALKLGDKGSMLLSDGTIHNCPSISVSPLDTTGAGDCFNAGFIFAWLKNQRPLDCLWLGNICGALSTRAMGGVEAFPKPEEINLYQKA